jgi:hypothetical protein
MPQITRADGQMQIALVDVRIPPDVPPSILGIDLDHVLVPWLPPEILRQLASATVNRVDNIQLAVTTMPTEILIPRAGRLRLQSGSAVTLIATGSTQQGLSVQMKLDPTAARALLWRTVDFAASGVHIQQGVDLHVTFHGLAARRITGSIKSGRIDAATLGIVAEE